MKYAIVVTLALGLTGCGLEVLTTTAITGELQKQDAERAVDALDRTEQQTARWEAQQAIQAYRAEHGRNPASLEELVPEYLAEVPETPKGEPLAYDPATGAVGEAAAQRPQRARLEEAIHEYARDHRHYPPNLRALTPEYLADIPRTESGEPFAYNPQTGAVAHPRELQRPQGGQQHGAQPQYQGHGGGNVGAYGRGSVGRIEQEHNQRQQQALEELGF